MKAKVAIVTGASSGIGLALVRSLVERRWSVVAVSRNASTKGTLAPADNLALIDGDVSHPSTAERAVETARRRFGAIDLLVNNAGIFEFLPIEEARVPVLEGLRAEEWVVAAGVQVLREGQKVRPVDRDNRPVELARTE